MSEQPFKIAFIGTHGVGKTTLCYGLAARLKARDVSLHLVEEVARRCPLPINRGTTVAAQSWILHTQIAEELIAGARYPVVICDRSILDNYVYLLLSAGRQKSLEELINFWTSTYDVLIHVPIIHDPRPDGMRSTDPSFQRAVEERLMEEMAVRGLEFLELVDRDRDEWVGYIEETIWDRLGPAQLELL